MPVEKYHDEGVYGFGPFQFDGSTLSLTREGETVSLQRRPAKVLRHLLAADGRVVSRSEIIDDLWPTGGRGAERSLNYSIHHLRKVLGDTVADPAYIATVDDRGYRFAASLERLRLGPHADIEAWERQGDWSAAATILWLGVVAIGTWIGGPRLIPVLLLPIVLRATFRIRERRRLSSDGSRAIPSPTDDGSSSGGRFRSTTGSGRLRRSGWTTVVSLWTAGTVLTALWIALTRFRPWEWPGQAQAFFSILMWGSFWSVGLAVTVTVLMSILDPYTPLTTLRDLGRCVRGFVIRRIEGARWAGFERPADPR